MMYFLFEGDIFYPCGGANDIVGIYGSIEEAKSNLTRKMGWAHIAEFSGKTLKIIMVWRNNKDWTEIKWQL